MTIRFTKNRQSGEFDIIGLFTEMPKKGQLAVVEKRDGSTSEVRVGDWGNAFVSQFGEHSGEQVVIAKVQKEEQSPQPGSGAPGTVCRSCGQVIPTNG